MSIATAGPDLEDGIYYPSSDGRPMGETGWHAMSTFDLIDILKRHFRDRDDVYVAGNMFLYYERGNPRANRAPDCMVCFGVRGRHERRSFKTWVEGVVPAVVFEFASPDTVDEDRGPKRDLYARLGVAEYYLFDPVDECLTPRLQGFHLAGGRFVPLNPAADGGLVSPRLGLRMTPEGTHIRLVVPETGERLLTSMEADLAMVEITREREQAEFDLERAEREKAVAERERERAERERDEARRRADELAAELERLRRRVGSDVTG